MADEPPYLAVGTGVSAKYKGAFCEAKIRKIVRSVKCKVVFKHGMGSATVADDQIKGQLRTGTVIEARHPDKKEFLEATITKIQDCSQYTVVFDDGDITTLRRTALCLKSGRHFAEGETLDQLPLTHPEHFSTPVIGGRRGRRTRIGVGDGTSDEEESFTQECDFNNFKEADIGRVVCVEGAEKKKQKDNWFPGLVVAPTAQDTVEIHVKDEYLVRSFKDGRYYTVPKKETTEFTREIGIKVDNNTLKAAVEKALLFLDRDELPPHWDRELLLYGLTDNASDSEPGCDNESSDDEPREEKDHFVAQLYKFMDDSGTPINKGPTICSKDVDLYRLFKIVQNLGGYNRVTNQNNWKSVSVKMGFGHNPVAVSMVKQSYKKFVRTCESEVNSCQYVVRWDQSILACTDPNGPHTDMSFTMCSNNNNGLSSSYDTKFLYSFEEFYRKLGCTMVNHPRLSRNRNRSGRSLIRDKDKAVATPNVKIEKDKVPEKSSVVPHENPPVLQAVPIKQEKIDVSEEIVEVPPKSQKMLTKKADVPTVPIKIKEEKKEEPEVKETKKEMKSRQTKNKNTDNTESLKSDSKEKKEPSVADTNKRKRIFGKLLRKDKPVKASKTDCLATSRQKRTIKEKVKALVDRLKINPTKNSSTPNVQEPNEKVPNSKCKVKEETPTATTKVIKKEETPSTTQNDDKKKGRKRKDKTDTSEDKPDTSPTIKTIALGDKLKVFYGPTHESKVTYEAKVLNIREECNELLYLVHYTGWNTRYDEWIKSNRIADNLSWVGGKTPKKVAQQTQQSKSNKREKKTVKSETPVKNENIHSTAPTKDASATASTSSGVRQGSVGRCTTPSSVSSSSSRTRIPTKRAYTRSANSKKELSASETEHEYESDYADVESSRERKNSTSSFRSDSNKEEEPLYTYSKRRRRKTEESIPVEIWKPEIKSIKEEKEEETVGVKLRKSRRKSSEKSSEVAKEPPEVTIKIEPKSDESLAEATKDDSMDSLVDAPPLRGFELSSSELESKENELTCMQEFISNKLSKQIDKTPKPNSNDTPTSRDFDLNQIRSELKGLDTSMTAVPKVTTDEVEKCTNPSAKDSETEDIYEFKEPEPFEFEARKSSEDKTKLPRRGGVIAVFDEIPKSSSSKKKSPESTPNISLKVTKPAFNPESSPKDDSSFESSLTIHTCEEAFDKICASPLRAATQEASSNYLQLFDSTQMDYDEDDDNYDDDSEDRLVISERDSDNYSNISNEKEEVFTMDFRNSIIETVTVKSSSPPKLEPQCPKECFVKDDDEDDFEALNDAIQSVIMESSDDTNDTDLMKRSETKGVLPVLNIENEKEPEEVDEVPDVNCEENNELASTDIANESTSVPPSNAEMDTESVPEEPSKENNQIVDVVCTVVKKSPDSHSDMEIDYSKKVDIKAEVLEITAGSDKTSGASKTDDDEENNIDSLLCEETIPGSPTPQNDCLGELEKERMDVNDNDVYKQEQNDFKIEVGTNDPTNETRVSTPPATPDSSMSSTTSPVRESEIHVKSEPKLMSEEASEFDDNLAPGSSLKKPAATGDSSSKNPVSDNRSRKEHKSGKKGRKTRKRGEDSAKKKYSRNRPHGSDSDDVFEGIGGRGESSQTRSPRPCKFNFAVNLAPEMDSHQKILLLNQALQELRKTYSNVKAELALVDRRRKKLRRRERENTVANNARSH